jgi:hypothetical protein
MKKIETLFTSDSYDKKNITNKSNVVISHEMLNKIETDGATYEILQELGTPVFKYWTQITIHGLFPELHKNWINGYKNLFQNKNLSIGVKYQAIDSLKKQTIYRKLKEFSGWNILHNSTDYYIYKYSEYFNTKEEYKQVLPKMQNLISHIDKSLFIGNAGIDLCLSLSGRYSLTAFINIGAIAEINVNKVIENICQANMAEIDAKIKADKLADELKQKAYAEKYQKDRDELATKAKPVIENFRNILTQSGYSRFEKIEVTQNLVVLTFDVTSEQILNIKYRKFVKQPKQRQFRYFTARSINEIIEPEFSEQLSYSADKYSPSTVTGWIKQELKPEPKKEVIKSMPVSCDIQIIDYSDKAIAVIGNTKPVKDTLKSIGGRFNFHLNCGAGWIFPKTKQSEVKLALNM